MVMTKDKMISERKKATELKDCDMSYCLPAKDYKTLQDAAYQDFSQNGSEGKTHAIYLDCLGNPTVGVGHLIMPKNGLGDKKKEEAYRQKYMALDLLDSRGKPLSNEEKYSQFSSILQAMKTKGFKTTGKSPCYISYPAVGKLSEAGVKQSFCSDYDYWYSRVKKKFPDLESYPLSLQLSLTHCGFAGALGKIKNKGDFVDIANQVAKVRSSKITSTKERQMAQKAARECKYLADNGLNPKTSSRENLLAALNVKEPSFSVNYDEMFRDVPVEQRQQKIAEYENRDNVSSGSVLRGLLSNEENDGDLLSAMLARVLKLALEGHKDQQESPQYVVDSDFRYQMKVSDFDVKNENFARDLAQQLTENINNGYRGYCTKGQQYCAGAGTGTLNQIGKNYDVFDMGVKGTGCINVKDQFAKLNGNDGYTNNCYNEIKAKINKNPTQPQVFTVMVDSKGKSNSGLHYVTIAPSLDKNGEILRDEAGNVKYSVYGFNRNVIKDIDGYSMLKRKGHVFSVTEIAQNREIQNENNNSLALMKQKRNNERA